MTEPLAERCARAVHVLTADGRALSGGRACLFVLATVGRWPRLVWLLAHRPFVWGVDVGYRIVAANRPFFRLFLFRK